MKIQSLEKGAMNGFFKLEVRRADGSLKLETDFIKNTIMYAGKAQLALLLGGGSTDYFTKLALGTSTTAVDPTQTALGAELSIDGLSRATATQSVVTTNSTGDTRSFVYTWNVTGSTTIQEIGIFSPGNTMLCRQLTGAIGVVATETVTATYNIVNA